MYSYLSGAAISPSDIVIAGVGYRVATPAPLTVGQEYELFVHTVVREDSITLFGFEDDLSRDVFSAVLKIAGVGPQLALNMIGSAGAARLVCALVDGDSDVLKGIKGVGPSLLKKIFAGVKIPDSLLQRCVNSGGPVPQSAEYADLHDALTALGYVSEDVAEALAALPSGMDEGAALAEAISVLRGER